MVLKAVALSLKQHPKVNSSWLGDTIRYNHHVNIGVAVAVEEGLLVPVVRFADAKSLSQINAEVKDFAQKAKGFTLEVCGGFQNKTMKVILFTVYHILTRLKKCDFF